MQVTLSRQTGKRLQYFVAYTLGQTKGTLGDEYRNRDPFDAAPHLRHPRRGPHGTS